MRLEITLRLIIIIVLCEVGVYIVAPYIRPNILAGIPFITLRQVNIMLAVLGVIVAIVIDNALKE